MIVIDVGCADRGHERSIDKLVERFRPDFLYGFDPSMPSGIAYPILDTGIFINPVGAGTAAWIKDGYVGYVEAGDRSHVVDEMESSAVAPCFDLADFIEGLLKRDPDIVLKLDCEGAEIPILKHLYERGIDKKLERILVEWHCPNCRTGGGEHARNCSRPALEEVAGLRCPVEEWK